MEYALFGKQIKEKLNKVNANAIKIQIKPNDKFVIFSDLHLGNGGSSDDFAKNAELFKYALKNHYIKNNFKLILNGDIEELHRFSIKKIRKSWKLIYSLFEKFNVQNNLYRIFGNHDYDYHIKKGFFFKRYLKVPVYEAVKLKYNNREILIFHGHQGRIFFGLNFILERIILRFFAKPLGISNYSSAHKSSKKYNTEKKVYSFAKENKLITVIGHTHRPLFESLSKIDRLKFKIERMCRELANARKNKKKIIEEAIKKYNREYKRILKNDYENSSRSSLYNSGPMVPCLFNSGCAIGKRGITGIEIVGGKISLVYWYDKNRSQNNVVLNECPECRIGKSSYFRKVLKEDDLEYIFARIRLLS